MKYTTFVSSMRDAILVKGYSYNKAIYVIRRKEVLLSLKEGRRKFFKIEDYPGEFKDWIKNVQYSLWECRQIYLEHKRNETIMSERSRYERENGLVG